MVFTAFLLGAQLKMDSVENKPEDSLAMSLAKAFNRMVPSLCGRQVALQTRSTPVVAWRLVRQTLGR